MHLTLHNLGQTTVYVSFTLTYGQQLRGGDQKET